MAGHPTGCDGGAGRWVSHPEPPTAMNGDRWCEILPLGTRWRVKEPGNLSRLIKALVSNTTVVEFRTPTREFQ